MTTLFAQPYDIAANGFYFETDEEFQERSATLENSYGDPVEEFEIQFIDGLDIDCKLADAWALNQVNFASYLDAIDDWSDDQKIRYIIAVGECGYSHEQIVADPDGIEMDLYEIDSLKDLAQHFVEEGLYGEIPESLQFYVDYDAIARDLSFEYAETVIAGVRYVYRCP